jgi:hypothetical protein
MLSKVGITLVALATAGVWGQEIHATIDASKTGAPISKYVYG